MWQQHADLDQQLTTLINQIDERLSLSDIFAAKYDRLMEWMDGIENRLDSEAHSVLRDPEELLRRLEKDVESEIALREREREWLLSSGRELLTFYATNSDNDQRTRNEIERKVNAVVERWERLKNLCKQRTTQIHELKTTMLKLQDRIAAIRAWLYTVESELAKPVVFESSANSAFDKVVHENEKLQRSIEKESSNVGEVLNLCEMLLSDVDTWKAHVDTNNLSIAVDSLDRRWKNVCKASVERKRRTHTVWTLLLEVLLLTSEQVNWIDEQENDLNKLEQNLTNLPKNQIQQRIDALESKIREFEQQQPKFKLLGQSYSKLVKTDGVDPANIQDLTNASKYILSRYEQLTPRALDIIGKLNMDMKVYREFLNTHGKAVVALSQIDGDLTKVEHLSKPDPEEQLNNIRMLEQELKLCESDLAQADTLGLVIMKKSKPEDIDAIQTLIDEYQTMWKDITTRITTIKTETTTTISKLKDIQENVQVQQRRFETDSAVQVNTLPGLNRQTSITPKDAYIYELEAALKECRENLEQLDKEINNPKRKAGSQVVQKLISNTQSSVELLNHLSSILVTECFCTDEEAAVAEVVDITAKKDALIALWKAKERAQESRYAFFRFLLFHSFIFDDYFLHS